MDTLLDLFKLVKDVVASFIARRAARNDHAWDQVIGAAEKLQELTTLHVKAIGEVSAPVIEEGDVLETSLRYNALANNPDFPQGYGCIRGILETAQGVWPFPDPKVKEQLRSLLDQMSAFQSGAFMLAFDSYHIADTMSLAAELVTLPGLPEARFGDAGRLLLLSLKEVTDKHDGLAHEMPTTQLALTTLVAVWCKAWQRHVQRTLYQDGRGLAYAVGQLKVQQHA